MRDIFTNFLYRVLSDVTEIVVSVTDGEFSDDGGSRPEITIIRSLEELRAAASDGKVTVEEVGQILAHLLQHLSVPIKYSGLDEKGNPGDSDLASAWPLDAIHRDLRIAGYTPTSHIIETMFAGKFPREVTGGNDVPPSA